MYMKYILLVIIGIYFFNFPIVNNSEAKYLINIQKIQKNDLLHIIKKTEYTLEDAQYIELQIKNADKFTIAGKPDEAIKSLDNVFQFILQYDLDRAPESFYDLLPYLLIYKGDILTFIKKDYETGIGLYKEAIKFYNDIGANNSSLKIYNLIPLSRLGQIAMLMDNKKYAISYYQDIKNIIQDLGGDILGVSKIDFPEGVKPILPRTYIAVLDFKYLAIVSGIIPLEETSLNDNILFGELIKEYSVHELNNGSNLLAITASNVLAHSFQYEGKVQEESIAILRLLINKYKNDIDQNKENAVNIANIVQLYRGVLTISQLSEYPNMLQFLVDLQEMKDQISILLNSDYAYKEQAIGMVMPALEVAGNIDIDFGHASQVIKYIKNYELLMEKNTSLYSKTKKWLIQCPISRILGRSYISNNNIEEGTKYLINHYNDCNNGFMEMAVLEDLLDIYIIRNLDPQKGLDLLEEHKDAEIFMEMPINIYKAIAYLNTKEFDLSAKHAFSIYKMCEEKNDINCMWVSLSLLANAEYYDTATCGKYYKLLKENYKKVNINILIDEQKQSPLSIVNAKKWDYNNYIYSDIIYMPLMECEKNSLENAEIILQLHQFNNSNNLGRSIVAFNKIKLSKDKKFKRLYKEVESIKAYLNSYSGVFESEFIVKFNNLEKLKKDIKNNYDYDVSKFSSSLISVQKIISKLKADEAFIFFTAGKDNIFINFLSGVDETGQHSNKYYKVKMTIDELHQYEKQIREGLNINSAFNINISNKLYKKLFLNIEENLKNINHIYMVTDSIMSSIPMNILVTDTAENNIESIAMNSELQERGLEGVEQQKHNKEGIITYNNVKWLGLEYAITVLPSLDIFLSEKILLNKKKYSFIGFGDPVLKEGRNCVAQARNLSRALGKDKKITNRIQDLCPLPDTSREILAISKILGASNKDLYLKNRATEKNVKSINFIDKDIVIFATHGLITEDIVDLKEPALVLTPPDKITEIDDGLLRASEIISLDLNAELVILSACNTASGLDKNAINLSGLTKAFFIAGADSILVSQWAVVSEAATALTMGMIKEMSSNINLSKSEALRASMLDIAKNGSSPHHTHPGFWAPFIIVDSYIQTK